MFINLSSNGQDPGDLAALNIKSQPNLMLCRFKRTQVQKYTFRVDTYDNQDPVTFFLPLFTEDQYSTAADIKPSAVFAYYVNVLPVKYSFYPCTGALLQVQSKGRRNSEVNESIKKADDPRAFKIVPQQRHIIPVCVLSFFLLGELSRRHRRDAPDGNGSQRPSRCPSPERDTETRKRHFMTNTIPGYLDIVDVLLYLYDEHDDCEISLVDGPQ